MVPNRRSRIFENIERRKKNVAESSSDESLVIEENLIEKNQEETKCQEDPKEKPQEPSG